MAPALLATKYKQNPSLEITEELARELAIKRIKLEYLPGIKRIFPDFATYPEPALKFMVDMAYNGGPGYFAKRHMVEPITRRDWLACIPLLPVRKTPSTRPDTRKIWREEMLRQASLADGP